MEEEIGKRSKLSVNEISDKIFKFPSGHHYLIIYSDRTTYKKIFTSFIKKQMARQPNSVILFLSFYDTTTDVRSLLSQEGVEVNSNFNILDILEVLKSQFLEVPEIEKLRTMTNKVLTQNKDEQVLVVADMSVFHHIKKSPELLEYERNLHKELKEEGWKEICFYHQNDFDLMFTEEQKKELLGYHKDRVVNI